MGPESQIKCLDLGLNQFDAMSFGEITNSPLYSLWVAENPFVTVDFGGITQLNLETFYFYMKASDQHLLTRVHGMSELARAQIGSTARIQSAYGYLQENHSQVPGVQPHVDVDVYIFPIIFALYTLLVRLAYFF